MSPKDDTTGSPPAHAMPLKVFARDTRGAMEQVVRGAPLEAGTQAPARIVDEQDTINAQIENELATASPDRVFDLALTGAAMGMYAFAIQALEACVKRAPDHAPAWRKLAELLRLARRDAEALDAEAAAKRANGDRWSAAREVPFSRVKKSERRLRERLENKTEGQQRLSLRNHLLNNPSDAAAMRLLAQAEQEGGLAALRLLERALDLCPDYIGAREDYAGTLMEWRRHAAAAAQTELLLAREPQNESYRYSHALALVRIGNFENALEILYGLVNDHPDEPDHWLLHAQTLRFMGRRAESVRAYRRCIALKPDMGGAWWGLADLKDDVITDSDLAAMRAILDKAALEPDSRMRLLYALAHALEQRSDFAASFAAYEEATALYRTMWRQRRKGVSASQSAEYLRKMKRTFSRENLATKLAQAPADANAPIPIFIVGMPRAGSTLVEQILASHTEVEATRELTLIGDITRDLSASRLVVVRNAYPDCLLEFSREQMAALGTRYIEETCEFRRTGLPWFIDKRPWNWLEAGFIHLILPQAKIIDIRREPMAACFAMYKQLLPDDASFSYDFDELGRYYNNYVALMDHWQSVLPGRIHFMNYEQLVEDADNEIRRLLNYCGLPFEENCLRFWETDRAVLTPSAEQVRRPIYRDALAQWRNFEPWLGRLKAALSQPAQL